MADKDDSVTQLPFDADQFIIPVKDTHGHDTRTWFRLQQGYMQEVAEIIQSKTFPYRSAGALLRHALDRHLKWLRKLNQMYGNKRIPSVLGAVDAINAVVREDEYYMEFEDVIEKLKVRMNLHKGQGDIGEARRLLLQVLRHVNEMPDGFWKDKYKKKIESDHADLIQSMPKADLLKFEEGD